jgi:hypothetical protein
LRHALPLSLSTMAEYEMNDPVGRPSSMAVDDAAAYGDVAKKGTSVAGMAVSGKYPKQG